MAGKNTAAFGIYRGRANVESAINTLRNQGFRTEDISVLLPENVGSKDMGTEKSTKAPEGATAGAGTGAVIGGTLGLLAGIGALAIPGLGPFIAAGPIVAALSGIGAGGVVGGFTGALIGLGIPEYEAKRYEGRITKGGILVSVHCDNSEWTKKAKDILEQTGAEDVSSTGEASADYAKTDRPMRRTGATETVPVAHDSEFRKHYQSTYGGTGSRYEDYAPAYQYGCRMADDEKYRGRDFNEVESHLRREYETSNPGGNWEKVKDAVRHGWDKVTGRATRGVGR
jgi:hypothetical protein